MKISEHTSEALLAEQLPPINRNIGIVILGKNITERCSLSLQLVTLLLETDEDLSRWS